MISVVICTYNRASVLDATLTSFFRQACLDAVDHELLIIDNNSTDRTRDVVEKYLERPTVRYVFEPRQGLSVARNRGVAESRGEFVALLDDDVMIDPEWLSALGRAFQETQADVIGGRSYLILEGAVPEWFGPDFRPLLSEVKLGESRLIVPEGRGLFGLNLAFRRSALGAAGGFDESLGRSGAGLLGGEETVVMRRIAASGGVIMYDPDVVVGHVIGVDRLKWDYFARLAAGIGRSAALWERHATFTGRIKAIGRSIGAFRRALTTLAVEVVTRRTPYERRRAWHRMLSVRSRLATQMLLLLRRG